MADQVKHEPQQYELLGIPGFPRQEAFRSELELTLQKFNDYGRLLLFKYISDKSIKAVSENGGDTEKARKELEYYIPAEFNFSIVSQLNPKDLVQVYATLAKFNPDLGPIFKGYGEIDDLEDMMASVANFNFVEQPFEKLKEIFNWLLFYYQLTPFEVPEKLMVALAQSKGETSLSVYNPLVGLSFLPVHELKDESFEQINISSSGEFTHLMQLVILFNGGGSQKIHLTQVRETNQVFTDQQYDRILSVPYFSNPIYYDKRSRHQPSFMRGNLSMMIFDAINNLAPEGMMIFPITQRFLSHSVSESNWVNKFWEKLVNGEEFGGQVLDAVIRLPKGSLEQSNILLSLLICRKKKTSDDVLIVDTSHDSTNLRQLDDITQFINKIVTTFRQRKEEAGFSRLVPAEEIKENNYNMNLALYVNSFQPDELVDANQASEKIRAQKALITDHEAALATQIKSLTKNGPHEKEAQALIRLLQQE